MPSFTEDVSWSGDHSSKASLLTLTNDSHPPLVSTRRRRSSKLTWTGILTTLFVFVLTAGPATALIAWILSRQFDGRQEYGTSLFDTLRKDSFIVDEGYKEANAGTSQTTAALRALTISSFANQLVAVANSFAMGLVAFRTAGQWIRLSEEGSGQQGNPTSVQYGLLVSLLGSSSYSAIARASKYSARRRRSRLPRMFVEALFFSCLLFALTHVVGLTDLWLHTTARSVLVPVSAPVSSSVGATLGVAFNQTGCLLPPTSPPQSAVPCLHNNEGWAANYRSIRELSLFASYNNSGGLYKAITLADANDTAIVIPSSLPVNDLPSIPAQAYTIPTFGSRSNCTILNTLCGSSPVPRFLGGISIQNSSTGDCYPSEYPQLPLLEAGGYNFIYSNLPNLVFTSVNGSCGYFNGEFFDGHTATGMTIPLAQSFATDHYPNPLLILMQLHPEPPSTTDAPLIHLLTDQWNMLYAACSLEFLNVTASYNPVSDSWALTDSVPSSPSFAADLVDPLISQYATDQLLSNMQATFFQGDRNRAQVRLEQELSRLAIIWPSGNFMPTQATETTQISFVALGSYPKVPVILTAVLLYIYAFLTLYIYFTSSSFASYDITLSKTAEDLPSSSADQTAIALSQRWLTNPLALVGFALAEGGELDAKRSVAKHSADMAGDTEEDRLVIGIHPNGNGETVFGLKRGSLPAKEI